MTRALASLPLRRLRDYWRAKARRPAPTPLPVRVATIMARIAAGEQV